MEKVSIKEKTKKNNIGVDLGEFGKHVTQVMYPTRFNDFYS